MSGLVPAAAWGYQVGGGNAGRLNLAPPMPSTPVVPSRRKTLGGGSVVVRLVSTPASFQFPSGAASGTSTATASTSTPPQVASEASSSGAGLSGAGAGRSATSSFQAEAPAGGSYSFAPPAVTSLASPAPPMRSSLVNRTLQGLAASPRSPRTLPLSAAAAAVAVTASPPLSSRLPTTPIMRTQSPEARQRPLTPRGAAVVERSRIMQANGTVQISAGTPIVCAPPHDDSFIMSAAAGSGTATPQGPGAIMDDCVLQAALSTSQPWPWTTGTAASAALPRPTMEPRASTPTQRLRAASPPTSGTATPTMTPRPLATRMVFIPNGMAAHTLLPAPAGQAPASSSTGPAGFTEKDSVHGCYGATMPAETPPAAAGSLTVAAGPGIHLGALSHVAVPQQPAPLSARGGVAAPPAVSSALRTPHQQRTVSTSPRRVVPAVPPQAQVPWTPSPRTTLRQPVLLDSSGVPGVLRQVVPPVAAVLPGRAHAHVPAVLPPAAGAYAPLHVEPPRGPEDAMYHPPAAHGPVGATPEPAKERTSRSPRASSTSSQGGSEALSPIEEPGLKLYDEDWWYSHLEERRLGGAPPDCMTDAEQRRWQQQQQSFVNKDSKRRQAQAEQVLPWALPTRGAKAVDANEFSRRHPNRAASPASSKHRPAVGQSGTASPPPPRAG
eukprot:TRINITY_DN19029_c0_g1_i1.p1 TRINITY_DN19029_c0_g1~~TRINITY_DN19029_c0_g1_i1.p1  ORF type:complete len:666 (-),score=102.14 TRINITY_DN19029_c0_g1_i1:262-2259(-)